MKQNMFRSCISGIVAGAATYLFCIFCAELAYISLSERSFGILMGLFLLCGAAITFLNVFFKNPFVLQGIMRILLQFLTFLLLFVLGGSTGFVLRMEQFFGLTGSSGSDNASGLLILTYMAVVMVSAVAAMMALGLTRMINRRK